MDAQTTRLSKMKNVVVFVIVVVVVNVAITRTTYIRILVIAIRIYVYTHYVNRIPGDSKNRPLFEKSLQQN